MYVFFDVDPKVSLERVAKRKGEQTHFDNQKLDFHKRVRLGFREFLKKVPHKVIDANKTLEEVKKDFISIIKELI